MAKSTTTKTISLIKYLENILEKEPNGLRNKELEEIIRANKPDLINVFYGLRNITKENNTDITQIKKGGPYFHKKFQSNSNTEYTSDDKSDKAKSRKNKSSESIFYPSFANFLKNTSKECTKAIVLGGKQSNIKWSTPDVVGVFQPKRIGNFQYPVELITVEIKESSVSTIEAFGQAISYKLFSHKVYIVLPDDTKDIEKQRIESLCFMFGIGLVYYNKKRKNQKEKSYNIKLRAQKSDPDRSYLYEFLETLSKNKQVNEDLFG